MNMNLTNLMFFILLIFSTLLSISSNSWLISWMGLEMNLMFFIPILKKNNNLMKSEFLMKYFIIQTISSANLMFMILMFNYFNKIILFFMFNIYISLMMKLSSAPFHSWLIQIIESLNWFTFLLISTWQKIAPLILMTYLINSVLILILIMFNCLIGSLGGLNQLYLRKLLTFSSINNMAWMFSTFLINETLWMLFFTTYSLMMFTLTLMFNSIQISNMNFFLIIKMKPFLNLMLILNLLSMGGMPPMMGFIPKWMIINNLINFNCSIALLMILTSLINLLYYFRLMYPLLTMKKIYSKYNFHINFYLTNMKKIFFMLPMTSLLIIPMMIYIY
uniref:NADH dehydrogenase subunit 2 n=1 Tax=Arctopsyche spinescens TaxID=2973067 RepID=UPI002238F2A9|nr:NADH dehydrogenase subunit 2 [Arctopsyche spinescens]UYO79357.1 NADH dehydrogenase subunit 2 [Arctopsyche spinescens]